MVHAAIKLCFTLLVAYCVSGVNGQTSGEVVNIGEKAELSFDIGTNKYCAWYKTIPPENIFEAGKPSPVVGYEANLDGKICKFTITATKFIDNGTWYCPYGGLSPYPVPLTVVAAPEEPYITDGSDKKIETLKYNWDKTRIAVFNCVSKGGFPAAEIEWSLSGATIPLDIGSIATKTVLNDDDTFDVTNTLTLNPEVSRSVPYSLPNTAYEKELVCKVKHLSGEKSKNVWIGKPYETTRAVLESNTTRVNEKEYALLTCKADGIPEPQKYQIQRYQENNKWENVMANEEFVAKKNGTYRCVAYQTIEGKETEKTSPSITLTSGDEPPTISPITTPGDNDGDNDGDSGDGAGTIVFTTWLLILSMFTAVFNF